MGSFWVWAGRGYFTHFNIPSDNKHSTKIFFAIRQQKYLEALDRQDRAKAVEILCDDLRFVATLNAELYKQLTLILTLPDFRQNESLSYYKDTKNARSLVLKQVKKVIELHPLLREKLVYPTVGSSRLHTLINQSLNWQHSFCKNPIPKPEYESLLTDHKCPNPTPAPAGTASSDQAGTSMFLPQNQLSFSKRPRSRPATLGIADYQNPNHEPKRPRPALLSLLEDLPTKPAVTLHQGSTVTSMEFHPMQNTLLLVGSVTGEITLWELAVREKLVSGPFNIWDTTKCSPQFQAPISVTRVAWSPDANFIGVAFSKHLIHLYAFSGHNDLHQQIEVESHVGAVNDLTFANPFGKVYVVTCGDDKLIKVWDVSGQKHFTFEGHDAPVYSLCPCQKEDIQLIFSTAKDGKIKLWSYDNKGSTMEFDAPGKWCTTVLYSADKTRLFSCGKSEDGDSFLVEWNGAKGSIKREYLGVSKNLPGLVQFNTSKNNYLAVGEDRQIKFWVMDDIIPLTSTDAEGGLPAHPRLRFNKEGNLLAVSTEDEGFKILANQAGFKDLEVVPGAPIASVSSPVRPSPMLVGADPSKPADKPEPWQLAEIADPSRCRQVTLPDTTGSSTKYVRLLYMNSGVGILGLGFDGIQTLWKWVKNEQNSDGKATTTVVPEHWQPNSGCVMTNDLSRVNFEGATPCIALANNVNDSYLMSSVGGKVSLFNLFTFKVMTTFMQPPPASTFLAFHPLDNNIIAFGLENSMIQIYYSKQDQVRAQLNGHKKRITGLAFSTDLNVLVSSCADAQLCFWSMETWEKRKSVAVQMPAGKTANNRDTRVQFHVDQIQILAVHETQLAIFDASKMKCIRQWIPQDSLSTPISSAVFSGNSQLIYTAFRDGNIGVFDADSFRVRCRISPSAYFPQGSQRLSPLVVAANPQEPNQFAVSLNDGSVKVIEPTEAEGKWGTDATSGASSSSSTRSNRRLQR